MTKRGFGLMWIVMSMCWPTYSWAQLAPTGAHYAGRASDTGHEGPNEQGGYATSIPLDLPHSRGALPVPLQVVSGAHGFGAAGVGWDVPLSYVLVDDSYGHRRPSFAPGIGITPRERVTVSLLGRTVEMVRQGSAWIGRYAPDLTMHSANGVFTIVDGQGVTYTFTQDPLLVGTGGPYDNLGGFWLLQSIHGRGQSTVDLSYNIELRTLPGSPTPVLTIDLASISYNPDVATTCFKHVINLTYGATAAVAPAQSLAVIGERVIARFHRLSSIDVTSRAACGAAAQLLRRYNFTYTIDPDTSQERLDSVNETGREGTPEASRSPHRYLPLRNRDDLEWRCGGASVSANAGHRAARWGGDRREHEEGRQRSVPTADLG